MSFQIKYTVWPIEEMCGYTPKTTFWMDFDIADAFGMKAIKDTYRRAFKAWKDNVEYFTELVMVLNWRIFRYYERNETYAKLYNELWEQADAYATSHFTGDDLMYYYRTTD